MSKKNVCSILSVLAIFTLFFGCQESLFPSKKLKAKVCKEIYTALVQPDHVKIEGIRTLMQDEIEEMQSYLLSDKGYLFDRTKKCLFIPEFTVTFEGKEHVTVLISFVCNQVKFVHESQTLLLDIDPMAEKFDDYMHKKLIPVPERSFINSSSSFTSHPGCSISQTLKSSP